ncbi:MAG TPA: hypothetical protein VG650_10890 [Mycobacteriales bacterium]|nr:hypothetical protein [Mycobacteriales bacterium]
MAVSWALKLERAEKHLKDIEDMLAVIGAPGPYTGSVRVEEQPGDFPVAHILDIAGPEDPMLPVVIGDCLFNMRSALDHVAVASVPADRRFEAQYPIFERDPFQTTGSGKRKRLARPRDHKSWVRYTTGMSPDVVAFVKFTQPYNNARAGTSPNDHALAVLGKFQNADKHRSLNVVSHGLCDVTVIADDGKTTGSEKIDGPFERSMLNNGTKIASSKPEVKVEIMGSLVVALACPPEERHREIPGALREIYRVVKIIVEKVAELGNLA